MPTLRLFGGFTKQFHACSLFGALWKPGRNETGGAFMTLSSLGPPSVLASCAALPGCTPASDRLIPVASAACYAPGSNGTKFRFVFMGVAQTWGSKMEPW